LRTGKHSAHGCSMEEGADVDGAIWTQAVPGSSVSVALRIGDVSAVLVHVIRRYH
jgi:hypothetical protein